MHLKEDKRKPTEGWDLGCMPTALALIVSAILGIGAIAESIRVVI
jgi:hypothetical protein